ncbi:RNase A-like domain-containing protein [Streptomyces roseicoloratus]|uniref:RNase A-like domain-containing protein n=1 Tax=Streptomyces roseicoloratus TaxID=2508722 RepID=A0ABY9RPD6_9ACTN|nr:RNase A-like domain-containing protein [Streptomyces roseicoloratus]WMX44067.1 RNase A-like domain-containing protein [Streptomyces roseicoloratus]
MSTPTPSPSPTATTSPGPGPSSGPGPSPQPTTTPTPGTTHLPSPAPSSGSPSPGPTPSPSPNASPTPPHSGPPPQLPPATPPAVNNPWTAPGGFDVQPFHLYQVSSALAVEQQSFHKALTQFLDVHAGYSKVGGSGTVTVEFATQYAAVLTLLLEVHGKAVVAIGGAAVGFTITADNFRQADAATHPLNPPFAPQAPPQVITSPQAYPAPPPFGVRDGNPVDDFADIFDDGDIPGSLMRSVIEEALRTGRALEILPLPNYLRVNELSQAWLPYQTGIGIIQGQLSATVDTITDNANADWNKAMHQFVSSLWGTTAWGKNTAGYEWGHKPPTGAGTSLPAFAVLSTTAQMLAQAIRSYAEAAEKVRTELRGILYKAIKEAVALLDITDIRDVGSLVERLKKMWKGLGAAVLVAIDTDAVNRAVDTYEASLRTQIDVVKKLLDPLREASRAVPTFASESARAQAFGSRSLFEFDRSVVPLNEQSRDPNARFGIDLASMEWERNDFQPPHPAALREGKEAHTIDKHIGLTPQQLMHRLRDQGGADASTFRDLPSAEQYVQTAVNDPSKKTELETWMRNQEQKVANGTFNPASVKAWDFPVKDANGHQVAVGTSVSQADFATSGYSAQAKDVHTVHVVLAYSPETKGFYVLTAYPKAP